MVFAISAPIRLPAKTEMALSNMVRSGPRDPQRHEIVHGNKVQIRWLSDVPKHMPKVLGFVHSVELDAGVILALVEARLLEPNGDR